MAKLSIDAAKDRQRELYLALRKLDRLLENHKKEVRDFQMYECPHDWSINSYNGEIDYTCQICESCVDYIRE